MVRRSSPPACFGLSVFLIAVLDAATTIIAAFVEVLAAIVLAHIDLELLGGLLALPAVVTVAGSKVAFGEEGLNAAAGKKLDVDPAKECATEMGEIGDTLAPAAGGIERTHQNDEDPDRHHVFGLHAEGQGEHKNFAIPIKDTVGEQDAVDSTRRADGGHGRSDAQDA